MLPHIPDGLGVRIPDSHSGGPGSIPGQGAFFHSFFFVLGWGRTGTSTLQRALEILGFGPCHHMNKVIVLGASLNYNQEKV